MKIVILVFLSWLLLQRRSERIYFRVTAEENELEKILRDFSLHSYPFSQPHLQPAEQQLFSPLTKDARTHPRKCMGMGGSCPGGVWRLVVQAEKKSIRKKDKDKYILIEFLLLFIGLNKNEVVIEITAERERKGGKK